MKQPWKPFPSADADHSTANNNISRRRHNPTRLKSSSIRGRISGPIPIPSPMNSDYHEQDHARSHSTAEVVHPTPIRTPLTPEPDNFYGSDCVGGSNSRTPSAQSQRQHGYFRRETMANNGGDGRHKDASRAVPGPRLGPGRRVSMLSPDTPSNAGSKDQAPQKKAGFRQTVGSSIGRLFGLRRKKRTPSQADVHTPESGHTAPSTMRTLDFEKKDESLVQDWRPEIEHKRSASLPHSMAHHSERLEDRPESARHSLKQDFSFSRKYPDVCKINGGYGRGDEPLGLSPRPASVHGRGIRQKEPFRQHLWYTQSTNTEDIGRAVTTKDLYGLKRRSRSLSALGVSGDDVDGPPLSAGFSFQRASMDHEIRSLGSSAQPKPELPRAEVEVDEQGNVLIDIPDSPLKPFTFDVDAMNKPPGLSITEFASFEPRIAALEGQVAEMRKMLGGLNGSDPEAVAGVDVEAEGRSYSPELLTSDSGQHILLAPHGDLTSQHDHSKGDGLALSSWLSKSSSGAPDRTSVAYTASARDGLSVPQQDLKQEVPEDAHRSLTAELHTSLVDRLETEIRARQALEEKVVSLEALLDTLLTDSRQGAHIAVPVHPPAEAISTKAEGGNPG